MFKQLSIDPGRLVQQAPASPPSRQNSALAAVPTERRRKPTWIDKDADYRIPAMVWSTWTPTTGHRALVRALTPDERMVVAERERELRDGLRPFDQREQDAALEAISAMLGGFRTLRMTEADAIATIDGLRRVVAEFPLWAIREGCLAIQRGVATIDGRPVDRRFAPNDGEVYGVIAGIVKPFRDALQRASALLEAPAPQIGRRPA